MLPEEIEAWEGYSAKHFGPVDVYPLPELLTFAGYTIILILDKVLFDSHALFDEAHGKHAHDPADAKLEQNVRASLTKVMNASEMVTEDQVSES